jgi:hypothetical protein
MVDAKSTTNPGEQTIDCCHERQDSEYVAENLTGDDETKNSALGEGM